MRIKHTDIYIYYIYVVHDPRPKIPIFRCVGNTLQSQDFVCLTGCHIHCIACAYTQILCRTDTEILRHLVTDSHCNALQ